MLAPNGARLVHRGSGGEARKVNRSTDSEPSKPSTHKFQAPLIAELVGADTCRSAGLTVRSQTPILAICRELLSAGINPDQALEIFRGSVLAVRVRSIAEAGALEVNGSEQVAP